MATGFLARYNGKIKVAQLWLDPAGTSGLNGIVDADSGLRFGVGGGIALALPVTATANTDFTMSIPPGARIASMTVYTTTAYGAATDCKIEIGTSAGDNSYVAQTSIKAAGIVILTPATSAACAAAFLSMPTGAPNLWIRLVQTGTASATGAATLVVDFDLT